MKSYKSLYFSSKYTTWRENTRIHNFSNYRSKILILKCYISLYFSCTHIEGKENTRICNISEKLHILVFFLHISRPHPRYNLSPLHYANTHVFPEIQTKLIKFGANIEAKTWNGQTPLHWAARTCTLENVMELLSNGADIDCQMDDGNTPLHMVMFRRWDDGIKLSPYF